MKLARIEDITFDEEDFLLFESDIDLTLKAKAIQFSILPKLNVMVNEAISKIRDIYGIEVLADYSTTSIWPAFREKRENELRIDYTSAYVGIGGVRKPVWKGLERDDKKDVKIVPFYLGFMLDVDGLEIILDFRNIKLAKKSYNKLLSFFQKYSAQIITLSNFLSCSMSFGVNYILHVDHIMPRSKGGTDTLSNFQTLCHLCNIGKSNKSDRNLRERN